jgi:PAS domain S-box-containing protein
MPSPKVRVLLVDDRPENLLSLEAMLSSPEYETISARSGEDALRSLLVSDCAIILLDVQMPNLDGFETADLIKANPRLKDIPIIFLTALHNDPRYVARGYRAGAVDYITKPIVPEILQSKVAVFAALHRSRQLVLEQAEQLREHERRERQRIVAELEVKALRREQQLHRRYRDLVESMRGAVAWAAEPESKFLSFVSPSAGALLGLPGAAQPELLQELVHPEDRERFAAELKELQSEGSVTIDHRLLRRDGAVLWLSTLVRLEPRLEGTGRELRGLSIDVTRQKGVEETLALLARASAELSAPLDVEQILEDLLRLCVPELAEAGAAVVDDDEEAGLKAARCTRGDQPSERPPLSIPLVLEGRPAGRLDLWSAGGFDDAHALLLEEIARRAAQAIHNALLYASAQEAVAHRDEFLSVASHELKTPLAPLKIQLQSCRRRAEELADGAPLVKKLDVAERQVDRLHMLVNSLLDVSRIRAGRLELELEEVDLAALVDEVASRFQAELAKKNVELKLETDGTVRGRWDRSRLDQVVSNLLNNGIKYGCGKPIEISVRRVGDRAVLGVRDQGIGIAQGDTDRIFNRFERAVTSQTAGGLGLGLYISQQIVRAHGGEIRVETGAGDGSRFVVELPLAPAAAPPSP